MAVLSAHVDEVASPVPLGEALDLRRTGAYRGYGEVVERALEAASRPGCDAAVAGYTPAGLPLFAIRAGDPEAKAVTVVLAGLHALEWIGVEVGLGLLDRLTAEPPEGRSVLLFPIVNADGYRAVEESLRGGRRRYVRGNRNGVDLNRNWPTHWRPRIISRLMPWLGSSGSGPASEPEVAAVLSVLDDEAALGHRVDLALSLHSFGRMILHPWGGRLARPEAAPAHRRAGRAVRDRLRDRYRVVQCSRWVPGALARGMEIDHLHARYGATALLVECSRGGLRLWDPTSWLQPFRWYNPKDPGEVARDLADALEPFLRGDDLG